MFRDRLSCRVKVLLGACAIVALTTRASPAETNDAELRALLEQQSKQIEELKQRLDAVTQNAGGKEGDAQPAAPAVPTKVEIEEGALRKIVSDYLKDNPGAGMPSSVQTGYNFGQGFSIRSAPNPKYVKWDDECSKIPFELRIRGRIQVDYYGYKVTDNLNHQTGIRYAPSVGDFSQLMIKRGRLIFDGTAFTPNLRYEFQLDGNTRGIGGFQNNKIIQTAGTPPAGSGQGAPGIGTAASPIGGGVLVDHAERIYAAWIAYDFHLERKGEPFCEDQIIYGPTFSLIAGKQKPFFALEEILGSANQQFVEFSMADYFFDADDDNFMTSAGVQLQAMEDRLFAKALVTNGNESQFPNSQMDDLPGLNAGFWYDFGGSWNETRKRWDLFGDCLADIDYSTCPVVRVGGAINFVWMDRRSIYGDLEQARLTTMPAGPGGTRLFNLLSGDGAAATPIGGHAVDRVDSYSYEAFVAAKYRGFSISNDWWVRNLNHFETTPNGLNNIIYSIPQQNGTTVNALFPRGGLVDYGMQLQGGYFVIPRKLEVVARWTWIRGQSGDLNGNGTFTTQTVPGVTGPVRVMNGAFRQFHEADEYAIGVNYYFKRQLLKWQTDLGLYRGGNPTIGGAAATGFIPGVDGYMLRTQLQVAF